MIKENSVRSIFYLEPFAATTESAGLLVPAVVLALALFNEEGDGEEEEEDEADEGKSLAIKILVY